MVRRIQQQGEHGPTGKRASAAQGDYCDGGGDQDGMAREGWGRPHSATVDADHGGFLSCEFGWMSFVLWCLHLLLGILVNYPTKLAAATAVGGLI